LLRKSSAIVSLPRPVLLFLKIDLLLLALAGASEIFSRFALHLGFPYSSPVLYEYFPDLVGLRSRFQYFHTLRFFTDTIDPPCMYPAPVAVLYRIFFSFRPHDLGFFLCFVMLCTAGAAVLFGRKLVREGAGKLQTALLLLFILVTSYPLWIELKQANMEICVWVIVTLGIWCFLHDRGYPAAACFGVAGAMKIFPFLYLGLLLARRQHRQVAFGILTSVLITIPSLWLVYPHIRESWILTSAAVAHFRPLVTLQIYPQTSFDHSIFGFFKRFFIARMEVRHLSQALSLYLGAAVVTVLLVYFKKGRNLPVINQVLCVCVGSIVLPPTSFDYTLMHLYVPWALLVLFALQLEKKNLKSSGLVVAFLCFAVLFVPETEIIVHGYSYAGQIKALTLLVLLFIGLHYPFHLESGDRFVTAS
jgi:hypothetical protein